MTAVYLDRPRGRTRYRIATDGEWCVYLDPDAYAAACEHARGCYQRAVLDGSEAISGSTLRGRARSYSAHYMRSVDALLRRLTGAGIPWRELRGPRGRRVLAIGRPTPGAYLDGERR